MHPIFANKYYNLERLSPYSKTRTITNNNFVMVQSSRIKYYTICESVVIWSCGICILRNEGASACPNYFVKKGSFQNQNGSIFVIYCYLSIDVFIYITRNSFRNSPMISTTVGAPIYCTVHKHCSVEVVKSCSETAKYLQWQDTLLYHITVGINNYQCIPWPCPTDHIHMIGGRRMIFWSQRWLRFSRK